MRLRAGIGVVAAAVALCALPASAASQAPPGRALVAFSLTVGDGHSELYLMRSDGSERRRLTGGDVPLTRRATSAAEPAWAPDGTRLVYSRGGSDEAERAIAVLRVDTGDTRTITSGREQDNGPAWSPDGSQIAFYRTDDRPESTSIYVVAADGGTPVRLTARSRYRFDYQPAWSPDGKLIAFSRITYRVKAERVDQDLMVMNADGSGAHRIARRAGAPAWSPDGTRIAFLSIRDRNGETCFEECAPNNELYVMNADGSDERRLTRTRGDEEDPAWSPDGLRIAFDSDRNSPGGSDGGGSELYSIGADGSCMTWLTNGGADSTDPAWQPGAALASDPGPGCGGVPRPPTADVDVSDLRSFREFPLYWLGPSFAGALLSGVTLDGAHYADCGRYRARDCPLRLELQADSTCNQHPFTYGKRGGGELDDPLSAEVLPTHRFAYRGAIVAYYPTAEGWDIYLGRTALSVFGVGSRPRDIRPVVRAVRNVRADAAPRALPAPAFPRGFWRKLARFERVARQAGSVRAAAAQLRVTPRAVRDKLALGRLLRRAGVSRAPSRC